MNNLSIVDQLARSMIGFDHYSRRLPDVARSDNYPPHNIEQTQYGYVLTMAVAGFSQSDIEITVQDDVLTIAAQAREDSKDRVYLHQGISARGFRRAFTLKGHLEVSGAQLENGLLNVQLVENIPEAAQPKRIKVTSVTPP